MVKHDLLLILDKMYLLLYSCVPLYTKSLRTY
ncbi:hypothetical protein VP393E501_P0049 [Vibrio phage 393E50-1]|nr:hypothetical protein VP393E501_P0049 [Vibrio phage 393E50-1]